MVTGVRVLVLLHPVARAAPLPRSGEGQGLGSETLRAERGEGGLGRPQR